MKRSSVPSHLASIPKLTSEEEIDLFRDARAGSKRARDKLITSHLRLVVKVAARLVREGVELDDLISAGTIGLLASFETFDPEHGARFCSYARPAIEQHARAWLKQSARHASDVSLDETSDDLSSLHETIADTSAPDPESEAIASETRRTALARIPLAVRRLSRSEQIVIRERFKDERATLEEIGSQLGRTRERVRQIESEALGKLRADLGRVA